MPGVNARAISLLNTKNNDTFERMYNNTRECTRNDKFERMHHNTFERTHSDTFERKVCQIGL